MKSWAIAAVLGCALVAAAAEPAPRQVKVLKNNVNLRAKPLANAEVAGQAMARTILLSKSMDGEWVEIVPPTNVDFWVLGDYLQNDVIRSIQKVNVRTGPGINFAIVGQLAPGDQVISRGAMQDWIKIAPPENCSLWIARQLVELVSDQPPKPEPAKVAAAKVEPAPAPPAPQLAEMQPAAPAPVPAPAAPTQPPAVTERPAVPISLHPSLTGAAGAAQEKLLAGAEPPPADLDLVPSLGQGQSKQYEGTLRLRGVFCRTPSRFRLLSYDQQGNSKTLCYVKGNNDQLSTLLHRPMLISGREYWVKRQHYPVLVPERIILK